MKAIVVAGGTGGHIYPALAIINKIKEKEPESDILYIGTTDRMEKDIVPKYNIKYVGIEMSGLNRKNIFKNISVLNKYLKAKKSAHQIIARFKPDIVIGVGGYITAPVISEAAKMGYKTVIHEQNSIPGLSNKMLAKKVDKIFISLPGSTKYFDNSDKIVYTGNPRSEEIIKAKKMYKREAGFPSNKKLVIIVMGSLGSKTMTEKLRQIILDVKDKNYSVMVITGKKYYDSYKDLDIPNNVKLYPFLNDLIGIMKDADLIVSRAGASTVSEITAIGLPSILVPSPYVTHNHQYLNAKELEMVGACKIIEEENFTSATLIEEIDRLLNDNEAYTKMHEASQKIGINNSATRIYDEIKKIVG